MRDPDPGRPAEPPPADGPGPVEGGGLIGPLAAVRRALPGLERDLAHPDPAVRVDAALTILRAHFVLAGVLRANADELERLERRG